MQTVTISFPHQTATDDLEVRMMVAGVLYEKGKLRQVKLLKLLARQKELL